MNVNYSKWLMISPISKKWIKLYTNHLFWSQFLDWKQDQKSLDAVEGKTQKTHMTHKTWPALIDRLYLWRLTWLAYTFECPYIWMCSHLIVHSLKCPYIWMSTHFALDKLYLWRLTSLALTFECPNIWMCSHLIFHSFKCPYI